MTDSNEDLKRQIKALESTIGQQKRALSTSRYSFHSNGPPPSRAYRYNPIRPRGAYSPRPPPVRPSRNMKLVVKNDEPSASDSSSNNNTSGTTQYISYANKLVKVGTANSASLRPPTMTSYRPRPAIHMARMVNSRVTIDGETFIRKGQGNKLVRAPSTSPAAPAVPATTTTSQRGVVNIEGENYVRTKKGSLVRVDALRKHSSQKTAPMYKKGALKRRPLCTKYIYGKCAQSATDCLYSHELTPETVPVCLYFQSDRCKKDDQTCPFIHVKVNPNAPICRDFVYKHFCAKGRKCSHRHVWECPDWVEKNKCTWPKCRLPHPLKEKAKTWKSTTPLDTPVVSKDEQDLFIKQYVRRPVFDQDAINESARDEECSDAETHLAEDECLSDEDLSGDEAAELLKWYDDNYVEEST
ncbi:hypothetical protein LPJ71_004614 [Coemansia sp. S17]|nr:hypothetical protein LPJ71_004614 [Coemansia sp. S17]